LSWHCFPPFDSSPNGEPLVGERIRQIADFPSLAAGDWKLTALFGINNFSRGDPSGRREVDRLVVELGAIDHNAALD